MTAKIALKDVHKSFGAKQVLSGVTLDIMPRESMVIIGGSGTGKSITIKSILGLVTPDKGEVWVDDTRADTVRGSRRDALLDKFGMLFQGGALFDSLTVWENVAFRLRRRMSVTDARDLAIVKLRRVGLGPENADLFPAELSGGMQKRVGLARAIADDPEIIFFDEPTTGLDPIMSDVINDLIREVVTEMGATALTITHDMTSVRRIADKVAMLHGGIIQWTGSVSDLETCGDPYVDQFINGRADGPIEALR